MLTKKEIKNIKEQVNRIGFIDEIYGAGYYTEIFNHIDPRKIIEAATEAQEFLTGDELKNEKIILNYIVCDKMGYQDFKKIVDYIIL